MPFSVEQFLAVFKNYNQSVWPIQIAFSLLAVLAIFLAFRDNAFYGKIITVILAFFWLWMGVVYHWTYFSVINKAAWLFGGVFILQSALFVHRGVVRDNLRFRFEPNIYGFSGGIMMIFALIVYPLLGMELGHNYPSSPTFGLPCPTTIFTLGMLLWTVQKPPFSMFVVPVLWSFVGFTAALKLGIVEDTGLLAAGLITTFLVFKRRRNFERPVK